MASRIGRSHQLILRKNMENPQLSRRDTGKQLGILQSMVSRVIERYYKTRSIEMTQFDVEHPLHLAIRGFPS